MGLGGKRPACGIHSFKTKSIQQRRAKPFRGDKASTIAARSLRSLTVDQNSRSVRHIEYKPRFRSGQTIAKTLTPFNPCHRHVLRTRDGT